MTKQPWDKYFEEPGASKLEQLRDDARVTKGCITYDCFNAKMRGETVYCAKGHPLQGRKAVTMGLISVLRGWTSSACKTCPDFIFNGEEEAKE